MRGRTAILILLGILIVLGAVIGIIVVQLFYRQPFIPQLTLSAMQSQTPFAGIPGNPTPMRILTATSPANPLPGPNVPLPSPELLNTPGPTETPGPLKEVCGNTGSYIILAILTDVTNPNMEMDGAIGFRVIQVNFSRERIIVYAIPPELVLPGANLQPYGRSSATLTDAFDIIYNAERSNADAVSLAANGVAQMINENLGILASHYMVVDTAAIEDFANNLGSMDVKVSATFVTDEFDFPRGSQKLDGTLIRKYIVTRGSEKGSEWDRVLRQNDVINAFRVTSKTQDPARFITSFISQREDGFISDLNFGQLQQLVCLANSIDAVRFRYFTLPQTRVNLVEDGTITIADLDSIRANIANSLGGTGE
jgi:anionic cell wall polymer biosynthesis LytR-Cps2A-Psr (LCP) family protein